LIFLDPENGGGIILRGKTLMVQLIKCLKITFLSFGEGSLSALQAPAVIAVWRNRIYSFGKNCTKHKHCVGSFFLVLKQVLLG